MSTYTQITYHIVFGTRDRISSIPMDHRRELYRYVYGLLKQRNCFAYRINGMEDHIHILTSLHPSMALADLIKEIKTASSSWMKDQESFAKFEHWQEGYGAFTHTVQDQPALIEYIKDQEDHHRKISFVDELRRLIEQAGLEFDERYLP